MAKGFYFGVEIECGIPHDYESIICDKIAGLVRTPGLHGIMGEVKGDSSIQDLRYGYEGYEFTTPPLGYNAIRRRINKICGILNSYEADGNKTCGLHVHVSNTRFEMPKYIKRAVHTWLAIEDVLLATQPPSRLNNRYAYRCLRQYASGALQDLPHDKERIISKVSRYTSGTDMRYHTLNLANLTRSKPHQTLEVRMHAFTTDAEKINNWITLLQQVFSYVIDGYKAKDVTNLFKMKISEDKINKTWDLLKIPAGVRQFYATRIQKNLFNVLARQQEAVVKLMELKPAKERIMRRYTQIQSERRDIDSNWQDQMRVVNISG